MLDKFSLESQKMIALAESLAFDMSSASIGQEHILLAFLKTVDNPLTIELKKYKITFASFYSEIKDLFKNKNTDIFFMEYTMSLKVMLEKAIADSREAKEEKVSLNILALSLLREPEGLVAEILQKYRINMKDVINVLTKNQKRKSELDGIADLHELSKIKKDPLIGREKELDQLIRALRRRNKPNAMLIGAPGIGKTAIVEELSELLVNNKVPGMENKRIYELDMSSVVGGTKYRGEFEEKLKKIIKKVKEDGNAILFIDEIHNIIKAGGAEGAIDASNIFKPYLSRGEIQIIGATTTDEYHQTIEKDKALNRRFQIIKVDQSTPPETKEILRKLKPLYESYYHILIDDELCDYIVDAAEEYVSNQSFPDKAIDILDNSCVIANNKLRKADIIRTVEVYHNVLVDAKNRALSTRKRLKERLFGQDIAIDKIYRNLVLMEKGIDRHNRPLSVMMFVGPSGVGKSEAAKIIAEAFLSHADSFIKLDMALYQEGMAVSKLVGSAPGYVGYGETPQFVKRLKAHPYSVVLLDEIDKAHVDICDFFLNIFDEGYFYDAHQEKIDCSNAIFIMTSNHGYDQNQLFTKRMDLTSKNTQDNDAYQKISQKFRLEFLNRIDDIISFNYLDVDSQKLIYDKYKYSILSFEFSESQEFDDKVFKSINEADLKRFGARHIKRTLMQSIYDYLEESEQVKK